MPARKEQPFSVKVWGHSRYVVHRGKDFWTEQRPDGSLVHHAGNLLDAPRPYKDIVEPKPCSVCKASSYTTTPRGRGVHPGCEGVLDVLPDDIHWDTVFMIAEMLGAEIVMDDVAPEREVRRAA